MWDFPHDCGTVDTYAFSMDAWPCERVLYHDLMVDTDTEPSLSMDAMRDDQQHSNHIPPLGEAAILRNVLLEKLIEALFVEVKLFQRW